MNENAECLSIHGVPVTFGNKGSGLDAGNGKQAGILDAFENKVELRKI